MRVAYLVHDTTDPTVRHHVQVLQAGGATVTVIGFRRAASAPAAIEGAAVTDLGRTYDARLVRRALSVLHRLVPSRAGRSRSAG